MINPYLFESDFTWRAERVQRDYAAAQRSVSLRSVRAAVGLTLIRIGTTIQGKARKACEGCVETGSPLRNAGAITTMH